MFPPSILQDDDVLFLVAMDAVDDVDGGRSIGGVIANLSAGAVGVSNLHAAPGENATAIARAAVRFLAERHPDRAIVGYGRPGWDRTLAGLQFEDVGPLWVWLSG